MKGLSSSSSSDKIDTQSQINKQLLGNLVKRSDFTDKSSVSYNAAMYLLLEVLEAEIQIPNKPRNISTLRNGLVHSFMKVEPGYVKIFIQQLINNEFNFNNIKINKFDLFNSLRARNNCNRSVKSDRDDFMPESDKDPFNIEVFEKTKDDVINSRQEEMKKQRENMNKFLSRTDTDPSANYAVLYSAGCFCEASDHIDHILKSKSNAEKDVEHFPDLKAIRGGLVHPSPSVAVDIVKIARTINDHKKALPIEDLQEEKTIEATNEKKKKSRDNQKNQEEDLLKSKKLKMGEESSSSSIVKKKQKMPERKDTVQEILERGPHSNKIAKKEISRAKSFTEIVKKQKKSQNKRQEKGQ